MKTSIPASLQGILWSRNIDALDLERDQSYIVHQVLAYGSLDQIRWLMHTYGRPQVVATFRTKPGKLYTRAGLHFVSEFILEQKVKAGDESKYLQSAPRNIGSQKV